MQRLLVPSKTVVVGYMFNGFFLSFTSRTGSFLRTGLVNLATTTTKKIVATTGGDEHFFIFPFSSKYKLNVWPTFISMHLT